MVVYSKCQLDLDSDNHRCMQKREAIQGRILCRPMTYKSVIIQNQQHNSMSELVGTILRWIFTILISIASMNLGRFYQADPIHLFATITIYR